MSDQSNVAQPIDPSEAVFDYNSNRSKLIISEYGRHIQNLIAYAKTIEDKEKRQEAAESIIAMMYHMVPSEKGFSERKDTLWKHFFRIANYDIDVTPPEGTVIVKQDEKPTITPLEYPGKNMKYRHYGELIQRLIVKAQELEDGPKKEEVISLIVSYMKMAYRTWNKEHFVNDDLIKADLKTMSKGTLLADDNTSMNYLASRHTKHPQNLNIIGATAKKKKKNRSKSKSKNNNNNRRRRR